MLVERRGAAGIRLSVLERCGVCDATGAGATNPVAAAPLPSMKWSGPWVRLKRRGAMPTILQNHYVLAVHNVRESARFYVDVLGFSVAQELGGWIFVKKDNCLIMLGECPNDMKPSELGCHNYFAYLRVDDVDAYYAQVERAGFKPLAAVGDKPWGMREFAIRTPDGHRLMIGQSIGQKGAAV
jgi:catechol 2,3-dioxygenase-like lactoylglutathione lyase family enzyme